MSRYEARWREETFLPRWILYRDGKPCDAGYTQVGPMLSEAEVKIIAFALNAVAEGRSLISTSVYDDGIDYDGPTEGVAP